MNGQKTASLAETIEAVSPAGGPSAGHPAAVRVRAASSSDGETRFLQERLALLGMVGTILGSISFVLLLIISAVLYSAVPMTVAFVAAGVASSGVAWMVGRGRPRSQRVLENVDALITLAMSLSFTLMASRLPWWDRPELVAAMIALLVTATRAILIPSSARRTLVISACIWLPAFLVPYSAYGGAGWRLPPGVSDRSSFMLASQIATLTWAIISVTLVTVTSRVIYGLRKEVREAQKLGQYTLLEKLGEGGMGQVFRAQHAMLRRPTAVKLLHPDRAGGPEDLARFEREVQLTAQLSHPNVVTVFDYGRTPDGVFYYAMELLDGHDLEDIVELSGPLPPARVVHILIQVASALAEAHAVGLIHRDIKPANIILCARGRTCDVAKVVDFGLVKQLGPAAEEAITVDSSGGLISGPDLSRAGSIVGTPMYLAPEALQDPGSVDDRADLYALGAVAYFLLTGTVVFGGKSVMDACRHHVVTMPEPPSKRLRAQLPDATIPEDLERLVLQCLRKAPADRPRSAKDLLEALTGCSVAGQWTDADAREAWTSFRERPRPSATVITGDVDKTEVSVSAKTIAIDLTRRPQQP